MILMTSNSYTLYDNNEYFTLIYYLISTCGRSHVYGVPITLHSYPQRYSYYLNKNETNHNNMVKFVLKMANINCD